MKRKLILFFVFLGLASIISPLCSGKQSVDIRVAISKDKKDALISVTGPFEAIDVRSGKVLTKDTRLPLSKVSSGNGAIKIGGAIFNTDTIRIAPKRNGSLYINKRRYKGEAVIFLKEGGRLLIVNKLDIESYIKGVLYHEISHKWPINAIKAQAVAARTYAMYQIETSKTRDFDVNADTSSQVYGGYYSEKRKTNRAVNFTSGQVLKFKGKVFPAYFHATCGGVTESSSELWDIDIAPLKGGRLCTFCVASPHYYWRTSFSLKELQNKLKEKYCLKGDLKDIVVTKRNSNGRIRTLKVIDGSGESFTISAKDFRGVVGPNLIRSTNFTIVFEKNNIVFNGKGWGHGVGLCQWGAYGMSRAGYDYKDILSFYYPGAKIVKE